MSDITFTRKEVTDACKRWKEVRDVVAGQWRVKEGREDYLPKPNPHDKSKEANDRYDNYVARALFTNFTGRTRSGLIGTAFGVWPELQMPTDLEFLKQDADGSGVGLIGLSQQVLGDVLDTGRAGLYVDYPSIEAAEGFSRLAAESGQARACIVKVAAEDIVNWRLNRVGGKTIIGLVVIKETIEEEDGFGVKEVSQWRELALKDGVYTVTLWRKENADTSPAIYQTYMPKDGNGKPWKEIPFSFVGATNNDATLDAAPLYDLAQVNLGWYRNSADFEESAFFVGQPQYWMSGLDEEWLGILDKRGTYVGSRAILPLPVNGAAGILQAEENTMCSKGMADKQDQMAILGARLVVKGEAVKTAEQSRSETQAAQSVLSLSCDNVSEAFTKALTWAAVFHRVTGECSYAIDTEFGGIDADPQQLAAVVAAWQQGALPTSDKNSFMRRCGLVDQGKTDDDIAVEIEQDESTRLVAGDLPPEDEQQAA